MKSTYCFVIIAASLLILRIQQSSFAQNTTATEKTISIKVKGISCSMDIAIIKKNVEHMNGVVSCNKVGNAGATTTFEVKYNPTAVSVDSIYKALEGSPSCENPNERPYKVKK